MVIASPSSDCYTTCPCPRTIKYDVFLWASIQGLPERCYDYSPRSTPLVNPWRLLALISRHDLVQRTAILSWPVVNVIQKKPWGKYPGLCAGCQQFWALKIIKTNTFTQNNAPKSSVKSDSHVSSRSKWTYPVFKMFRLREPWTSPRPHCSRYGYAVEAATDEECTVQYLTRITCDPLPYHKFRQCSGQETRFLICVR